MKLPFEPTVPLAAERYDVLRRRMIFENCKWDTQVEDVSVLAPFALQLGAAAWDELIAFAETLSRETQAAEAELRQRPELHRELGLSWRIRQVLNRASEEPPAQRRNVQVNRFDFHFTTEGWRISEVNSDVPGGFNEATGFTRLMAQEFTDWRPAGNPVSELANAITGAVENPEPVVALVHATAYTDDRQVMTFLAQEFAVCGIKTILAAPDHLRWQNGKASVLDAEDQLVPVDFVYRFFPAEWLPNLPSACQWQHFFMGSVTPHCNPATALLTQTKRFPLVWDKLSTALPTWRQLLPPTHDPRTVNWRERTQWVVKPSHGRVGDSIGLAGATTEADWKKITRSVRWHPRHWVAQRRFETMPVSVEGRDYYPCLGVYTVNHRAAGIYGRLSRNPLIDHRAQDCAVLVAEQQGTPEPSATKETYEAIGTF